MTMSSDSSERRSDAAWRSPLAWTVLLVVVVVGLASDLVSKDWAFRSVVGEPVVLVYEDIVAGGDPIPFHPGVPAVSPDLLDFRLVLNRGAVFGIGQGRRVAFVVFTTVAIVVALAVFGGWTRRRAFLAHVAIGLILAGGLGNLYDRLVFGAVRDFLHMFPRRDLPLGLSWPRGDTEVFPWVFNVADVELLVGMCLLLIHVHLVDRRAKRDEVASSTPTSEKPAARGLQEAE
ncbi:MAG: signal peptidase II [Planctomycetota bacterium]|nr:signal peptidase II [Planctomycetota bacterium]